MGRLQNILETIRAITGSGCAIFQVGTLEETLDRCLRRERPFAQEQSDALEKGDGKRKTDHGLKDWLIFRAAAADAQSFDTWGFISNDRGFAESPSEAQFHLQFAKWVSRGTLFESLESFEHTLAARETFDERRLRWVPRVVRSHFGRELSSEAQSVVGATLNQYNWSPALLGFASDSGYVRVTTGRLYSWTPKYWWRYSGWTYDVVGEMDVDLEGHIDCPVGYDVQTIAEQAREWGAVVRGRDPDFMAITVRRKFDVYFRLTREDHGYFLMCAIAQRLANGRLAAHWTPSEGTGIAEVPKAQMGEGGEIPRDEFDEDYDDDFDDDETEVGADDAKSEGTNQTS